MQTTVWARDKGLLNRRWSQQVLTYNVAGCFQPGMGTDNDFSSVICKFVLDTEHTRKSRNEELVVVVVKGNSFSELDWGLA